MNIIAIERDPYNSPGMADNDHAILSAVVERLNILGHNTTLVKHLQPDTPQTDAIVHMSRKQETLQRLKQLERQGTAIFNAPQAVERCSRSTFIDILEQNGIPQPRYSIIRVSSEIPNGGYPMWIKRGDGWSCHPCDVSFASNKDEATEAINNMLSRGAKKIISSPHLQGDVIKFYGVTGSDDSEPFFRMHYPDAGKTKFGLERHNGECNEYRFDKEELQRIAFAAATAVGIEIFGGDCIISSNGKIHLIDLNDFPSFSAYRDEAAAAIAKMIDTKIRKK